MCMYIFEQPTVMVLIPLQSFLLLPPRPSLYLEEPQGAAKPCRCSSSISGSTPRSLGAAVLCSPTLRCALVTPGTDVKGYGKLVSSPRRRVSLQRPSWARSSPVLQVWFSPGFLLKL